MKLRSLPNFLIGVNIVLHWLNGFIFPNLPSISVIVTEQLIILVIYLVVLISKKTKAILKLLEVLYCIVVFQLINFLVGCVFVIVIGSISEGISSLSIRGILSATLMAYYGFGMDWIFNQSILFTACLFVMSVVGKVYRSFRLGSADIA